MLNRTFSRLSMLLLVLFVVQVGFGQGYQRLFNAEDRWFFHSCSSPTNGGGYYLCNVFLDLNSAEIGVSVTKHEVKGDIFWAREIIIPATDFDIDKDIECQTIAGDTLVIVASNALTSNMAGERYLMKLEPMAGEIAWAKQISELDDTALGIVPTARVLRAPDNSINYFANHNAADTIAIHWRKFDTDNNSVTDRSYYTVDQDTLPLGLNHTDVEMTRDSGYIVSTLIGTILDVSGMIKLDSLGEPIHANQYRTDLFPTNIFQFSAISATPDTGYVTTGVVIDLATGLPFGLVAKTDSVGVVSWAKVIDLLNSATILTLPLDIIVTESNEILVGAKAINATTGVPANLGFFFDLAGNVIRQQQYISENSLWAIPLANGGQIAPNGLDLSRSPDGTTLMTTTGFDSGAMAFAPLVLKIDQEGGAMCHDTVDMEAVFDINLISDTLIINELTEDITEVVDFDFEERDYSGSFLIPIVNLPDTNFCPQDPVIYTLDATTDGGVMYAWSTGDTTEVITVTEVGDYAVTVTIDERVCFTLCDTVSVTQGEFPIANVQIGFDRYCQFGEYVLIAGSSTDIAGGVLWSDGQTDQTIFVPAVEGNVYTVTITDSCENTAEASLTLPNDPSEVGTIVVDSSPLCEFGIINLAATSPSPFNPYEYNWSNGETTQSIQVTDPGGTFSVTITDSCGFESYDTVEVPAEDFLIPDPSVTLSAEGLDPNTCGLTLVAAAQPGSDNLQVSSILWSNGVNGTSIIVDEPGVYSVVVTNNCGKTATAEITVTAAELDVPDPSVTLSAEGLDLNTCGLTLVANAQPGSEMFQIAAIVWSTGVNSTSINVDEPGIYSVVVTDNCGQTATADITVSADDLVIPPPAVEIVVMSTDSCDVLLVAEAAGSASALGYAWSTGEVINEILVQEAGLYTVTVTDNCGNSSVAEYDNVIDAFSWPNVFFPRRPIHDDNGSFGPYLKCPDMTNLADYNLQIYNRWGKLVFESDNPVSRWSGTLNSSGSFLLEEDVYFYQSTWVDENGTEQSTKGHVTMVVN